MARQKPTLGRVIDRARHLRQQCQGQRSRALALRWFCSRGAAVSRTYRLHVLGVHPGGRTGYRLACRLEHEPNVVQLVDVEVGG